jgi:hypothetical protein
VGVVCWCVEGEEGEGVGELERRHYSLIEEFEEYVWRVLWVVGTVGSLWRLKKCHCS